MNDNFDENLAKLCQKADQLAQVTDVAVAATAGHDRPARRSAVFTRLGVD